MMRLLRLFRNSPILAEPIGAWTDADAFIARLDEVGQQMHDALQARSVSSDHIDQLMAVADQIHERVAPLEDAFSTSLGRSSRLVLALLSGCLAFCSTILIVIGATISRNTIRRGERIARAMRESQEQAYVAQARSHVTLESIADAVICTDLEEHVTYMNGAAELLTGWTAVEADRQALATVLTVVQESTTFSVTSEVRRILSGEQRAGSAAGSLLKRRDGTAVPIHEHAAPICDSHGEVIGIVFVLRDITQEREFAAQLQHQASHDALTGLANRRPAANRNRSSLIVFGPRSIQGRQRHLRPRGRRRVDLPGVLCGEATTARRRPAGAVGRRRIRHPARELLVAGRARPRRIHPRANC